MSSSGNEAEVIKLEHERYAAMLAKDTARLRALFDPDLQYIHSSGELDTLEEYLGTLESGAITYNNLIPSDLRATDLGGVVLIDGKLHLDAIVGGVPRKRDNRTTSIWVKRGAEWRHIRFHAVPFTAPATSS